MKSPFEELQIDPDLVCEFFAVFSRFEYAMKATRYCGRDRHMNAVPDWKSLMTDVGETFSQYHGDECGNLIEYLLTEPPQVQKVVDGQPRFVSAPLEGETVGAKAIEAAKRVRNNLFHGGKHTAHSPPERDTQLVKGALAVLELCLAADGELNSEFELQVC